MSGSSCATLDLVIIGIKNYSTPHGILAHFVAGGQNKIDRAAELRDRLLQRHGLPYEFDDPVIDDLRDAGRVDIVIRGHMEHLFFEYGIPFITVGEAFFRGFTENGDAVLRRAENILNAFAEHETDERLPARLIWF